MASTHFAHLHERCLTLIAKYAEPIIAAEQEALDKNQPLPDVDIDHLVALRLIAHAEFEYYFEEIARTAVEAMRSAIQSGQTASQSALVFFYIQRKRIAPLWTDTLGFDEQKTKDAEVADFKNLLTAAIGFATDMIESNNGIKESCIHLLSSFSGRFPGEVSTTLVTELNTLGSERGAVAHKSWKYAKKANIQSATIERNRILSLLKLIEETYER